MNYHSPARIGYSSFQSSKKQANNTIRAQTRPGEGLNPLIRAASVVFEKIDALQQGSEQTALELQQELMAAIKGFVTRATRDDYPHEIVLMARYALCATIDETLLYHRVFSESFWQDYKLLTLWPVESMESEQFFLALERLKDNPLRYLDLLELIYLCFSVGLEGFYRFAPRGSESLSVVINNLYQTITQEQGEFELALSPKAYLPHKQREKMKVPFKLRYLMLTTVLLLAAIYTGFNLAYQRAEQPLAHALQQLIQAKSARSL